MFTCATLALAGCSGRPTDTPVDASHRIEVAEQPVPSECGISVSVGTITQYATDGQPPEIRVTLQNKSDDSKQVGFVGHGIPPTRHTDSRGLLLIPSEKSVEPVSDGVWIPDDDSVISESRFSSVNYRDVPANDTISRDYEVWIDPVANVNSYPTGVFEFESENMGVLNLECRIDSSFKIKAQKL